YLAPQHIDPKFLDPKHVFKDVSALPPVPSTSTAQPGSKAHNNVFQPEKKRRARDGYAEGDYTLFHAVGASELVHSHDPVTVLGSSNQITFKTDEEKEWLKHESTTSDILTNCEDLKVLGKGDFKRLLKWRTTIREEIGLETKNKPIEDATETVEITEEVDEEQQIEDELQRLTTESAARAKRDRRRANEKRTRTIMRMQLQMTAPLDIGMDFKDDALKGDVFDLGEADGRKVDDESGSESESEEKDKGGREEILEDDSEDDGLEEELDGLYDRYRERLAERDLKFKAKEARRKDESREEWGGIKKDEDASEDEDSDEGEGGWDATQAAKDDDDESSSDDGEGSSSEEEPAVVKKRKIEKGAKLITKFEEPKVKASKAAQVWFSQDLFKGVADNVEDGEESEEGEEEERDEDEESEGEEDATPSDEDEDDFEIVPQEPDNDDTPIPLPSTQHLIDFPEYGLLTPEAQTLAHKLVNRQTTKTHLLNDGFTRYSLNDQNDIPAWFLDDERKHYKPNIPITKEAMAALRAKQRALDARPIKKVAEAKARKKLRAQQRLEKAMKKAEGVNETDDMTEKEKAAQIEKLMSKGMSKGKKKKEVKVVVAKGVHKGIKGRPKGVKGRYAMVDARMRKEIIERRRPYKPVVPAFSAWFHLGVGRSALGNGIFRWLSHEMEARRQYNYVPGFDSWMMGQYSGFYPEPPSATINEDVQMGEIPPTEELRSQDAQQLPLPDLFDQPPADSGPPHAGEAEDTTPEIEFSTQWNNRREAQWEIVGPPKRGVESVFPAPAPQARAAPKIWAENIYDAQDVLPYFTVGQTILASKIPREVSRSILLTKNLHDIRADWRSGKIEFIVQVRDVPISDPVKLQEEDSGSKAKTVPNRPRVNTLLIDPRLRDNVLAFGDLSVDVEVRQTPLDDGDSGYSSGSYHTSASPTCLPNIGNPRVPMTTDEMDVDRPTPIQVEPPEILPEQIGLELEPTIGTSECLSRAPKLRASLLLGWHCSTCGRLNPRKKWSKNQSCPLCETTSTLILPEWHRRAHTEAAGPIGTLFRLDDGGHQPKTGLHQMAVRDEETGLTFVEYWLAEAPMPIIAELNRGATADRRKIRRKTALPKTLEGQQPNTPTTGDTLTPGPDTPTPISSASIPAVPSANTQLLAPAPVTKDGIHPDGGRLVRQRDPGGSRAIFSENTRMLFMHITRPQHSASLDLVDEIFTGFATDVRMERQENSATYRTGASALSCHYTYLAGCGSHIMHTSSAAVGWDHVPACVYDAHGLLVDYQTHTVFDDNMTIREFNQSIYIMGNGAIGTNTFRITHRAEDGPVGYMVFGASCSIEILVGNGNNSKRTTKGGAARRAEMLLAHGDALVTTPVEGDAPLEVRVKRTGLAV
ncbi:AdoMet-dependent rRNA methyltransferase spb1, partial [Ceratobasidium sp. 423]